MSSHTNAVKGTSYSSHKTWPVALLINFILQYASIYRIIRLKQAEDGNTPRLTTLQHFRTYSGNIGVSWWLVSLCGFEAGEHIISSRSAIKKGHEDQSTN